MTWTEEANADRLRCGCPEQYKGVYCPACHSTGKIPPIPHAPLDLCDDRCERREEERRKVEHFPCMGCGEYHSLETENRRTGQDRRKP